MYLCHDTDMDKIKRITANIPGSLLRQAVSVTNAGITETLILGLKMIKRSAAHEKAVALRGKLNLDINLDMSRERSRH